MTDDEIRRVAAVTKAVLDDPVPIGTISHFVCTDESLVLVELQIKIGADEWVALDRLSDEQMHYLRALGITLPFNRPWKT